jgi:hypothetical protein
VLHDEALPAPLTTPTPWHGMAWHQPSISDPRADIGIGVYLGRGPQEALPVHPSSGLVIMPVVGYSLLLACPVAHRLRPPPACDRMWVSSPG